MGIGPPNTGESSNDPQRLAAVDAMPVKIALTTASDMPKPDEETHLLVEASVAAGMNADVVAWDSAVDWEKYALVVIRTTWDYFKRLPEFIAWARQVDAATCLVNPLAVIEWNCHKRYLQELWQRRVPTVPTLVLASEAEHHGSRYLSGCDWAEVVIKPAVSIGAIGALRCNTEDRTFEQQLADLLSAGDVLVQPFVSSVMTEGEISLIYFGGRFSHAIRKLPKAGEYRVQDHHGGSVRPHNPSAGQLKVAGAALAAAPAKTAYARVDLVTIDGSPVVMELELIEPALFLSSMPSAAKRFAGVLHRLAKHE